MLVTGDREAADGTVAVRSRTGGDLGARAVEAFIETAQDEVRRRAEGRRAEGKGQRDLEGNRDEGQAP